MPPERTRLLKFVNSFGMGGTERHVVNLGRAIDPSRFDLHLACFKRWGHFLEEVEARHLPILEYPIDSLYNHRTLRLQVRFAMEIRRRRIQIVHAYNFYPNVFAVPVARVAGTPVVLASIRDTGVYLTPRQKRVQRLACWMADCIVVNAEAVRQWLLEEGYPREKIVVIRNGVDTSRFGGTRDGDRLRRELGLPPRVPLVAVLSRLHHLKGLDYFLEAAATVAGRDRDIRFLIIGDRFAVKDGVVVSDGAYRSDLEERARRLGIGERVVFTGFRIDVPDLLAESAVSVLPSLSEGLPNTVLESMAAGVPVVATTVGGIPEVIEDGVSGLLVPPRDTAALVRAIGALLEKPDLARRIGEAGRRRVAERFSLEVMARDTERLYVDLLQDRRAKGAIGVRSQPAERRPGGTHDADRHV